MLALRAIFTVAIRPAGPLRRPEGTGQRKAQWREAASLPSRRQRKGSASRLRLQETFWWSACCQIAKQLGSPPKPGRGGRGAPQCFCASAVLLCSLCCSREFLLHAQVPDHLHLPLPGLLVLWIFRGTGL